MMKKMKRLMCYLTVIMMLFTQFLSAFAEEAGYLSDFYAEEMNEEIQNEEILNDEMMIEDEVPDEESLDVYLEDEDVILEEYSVEDVLSDEEVFLDSQTEEDLEAVADVEHVYTMLPYRQTEYRFDERYLIGNEEAVLKAREYMGNKEPHFSLPITISTEYYEEKLLIDTFFEKVYEETDKSYEGDYMRAQVHSVKAKISNGIMDVTVSYLETKEQQDIVGEEIEKLISDLHLRELENDYEKIKKVYDWMVTHITYDYDNYNKEKGEKDNICFTAYAGIHLNTCVCNGYASLFYRIMRELDIPVRCILGKTPGSDYADHIWNIVGLNGIYYPLDATWDAAGHSPEDFENSENPLYPMFYWYFLKSENYFVQNRHERVGYSSYYEFYNQYPVAESDFPYITVDRDCQAYYKWYDVEMPELYPHCVHEVEVIPAVPSTCQEDGMTAGMQCKLCGEVMETQKVIPAEHLPIDVDEVEATCYSNGITAYTYCERCGEYLSDPPIEHRMYEHTPKWVIDRAATINRKGFKSYECQECGEVLEEKEIPKLKPFIKYIKKYLPMTTKQSCYIKDNMILANGDSIVSWKSSNKKIATVNKKGKVRTYRKAGKAVISFKTKTGRTGKVTVVVKKRVVKTKSLTINDTSLSHRLLTGMTYKISTTRKPVTSTQKVTYKSMDPNVVTVNSKGNVVAVGPGTCQVEVKSGTKTVYITFYVLY